MSAHLSRRRSRTMADVSLIVIGMVFFLDQMAIVAMQDMPMTDGYIRMIDPASSRDVASGAWTMLIGLWLFANFEEWYGINFDNSWPVLLIGWGITLLLRPLLQVRLASQQTDADASRKENNNAF